MSSITSPHASRDITAPPDWQAIHQEVKCPLCDYNLRGLHEPRCPECGYQFDWPSVLDPNKRLHPYLFEHHPERNIRSYVQTLLQHLRPKNFWRMANPAHRLRPARIVLYWALYALVAVMPAVAALVEAVRYRMLWTRPGYRSGYVNSAWQIAWSKEGLVAAMAALLLALFPWFNFLALMIFQQSMKRAKVKASHVVRCAIYSGDVLFWYGLAATIAVFALGPNSTVGRSSDMPLVVLLPGALLLFVLLNGLRLWFAYVYYMKFKAALATVLASEIIVGLTIFTVFMYVMTH